MTTVLLTAACAWLFGGGDYCGGLATRRSPALAVVVTSQVVGVSVLAVALVLGPSLPSASVLLWGMAAGGFGMAGIVILFRGLADGSAAVVSPAAAFTTSLVPLVVGVAMGDRLSGLAVVGVLLALASAPLLTSTGDHVSRPVVVRSLQLGLASGLAFGIFFSLLARAGDDVGLWPLAGARLVSIPLATVIALASGTSPLARAGLSWAVPSGLLDMAANAAFLAAVSSGDLAVVGALLSLYPMSTIALARVHDAQHVRPVQLVGLVLAGGALVSTAIAGA